jgi:hypothetical protein
MVIASTTEAAALCLVSARLSYTARSIGKATGAQRGHMEQVYPQGGRTGPRMGAKERQ